jgi:hypothetical protein
MYSCHEKTVTLTSFLWARFSQRPKATSSSIAVKNICRLRPTHYLLVLPHRQGQIQILWGLKLIQLWGLYLRKIIKNFEYISRLEREYLLMTRRGPWKGPMQVRGPEAKASLTSRLIRSCSYPFA